MTFSSDRASWTRQQRISITMRLCVHSGGVSSCPCWCLSLSQHLVSWVQPVISASICTNDQCYNTLNQYVCRQEVSFLFLGQSVITWSSHSIEHTSSCFDHRHTLHVALPPSSFHSPSSEVPLSSHSYFQRSRPCPLPHPPGQLLYVQPFVHASCDLCMTECVDACMLGKGPRDLPPFTKQMRNLLCGWLYCLCRTQS